MDKPDNLEKGCSNAQPSEPQVRTRRRFLVKHPWIILTTVALTWFLFSYLRRPFFSRPHQAWSWAGGKVGCAHSAEDAHECTRSANWTTYYEQPHWAPDFPLGAETTLTLPIDSDVLSLISKGPLQYGQVNIEQSSHVADTLDVRVRVAYHYDELLEHATVCQLEKHAREHGVGIFTSLIPHPLPYHGSESQLRFDITLTLPTANQRPLSVKKLVTKLPNYGQNVADLEKSVFFESISLTSANGLLNVQSVACETCQFSTINGEIEGHFSSPSFLDLNSLNGAITPTVNLLHREGERPPKLAIHSANGQIGAEISLTSEAGIGGEFDVNAELKNGDVGLKFTDTPVDSVLHCRAETISGDVQVELDRAFEGAYSLQSIIGKKVVSQHSVEDPAGKGRQRVVTLNEGFGQLKGELKWVENDGSFSKNDGYVTLKAVTASLKLVV